MHQLRVAVMPVLILALLSPSGTTAWGKVVRPKVMITIINIGREDGVWLESLEWIEILKTAGYDIHVLTGRVYGDRSDLEKEHGIRIYEDAVLGIEHPAVARIKDLNFVPDIRAQEAISQAEMRRLVEGLVAECVVALERHVRRVRPDIFISENANAIPVHLALGDAVRILSEKMEGRMAFVDHLHDFFWEDSRADAYVNSGYEITNQILERSFPGASKYRASVVINKAAIEAVSGRFGIDRRVIQKLGNIRDLRNQSFGKLDTKDQLIMRRELGIPDNAPVILQPTRVVPRKNIEATIEWLAASRHKNAYVLVTGESDPSDVNAGQYQERLQLLAQSLGVADRIIWAGEQIQPLRGELPDGRPVFSLSDAYAVSTIVSYPSTYEGWGNAFLEAIWAGRRVVVNRYARFIDDIDPLGFDVLTYDNGLMTAAEIAAADQVIEEVLRSTAENQRVVDNNTQVARHYLSYAAAYPVLKKALQVSEKKAAGIPRSIVPVSDLCVRTGIFKILICVSLVSRVLLSLRLYSENKQTGRNVRIQIEPIGSRSYNALMKT